MKEPPSYDDKLFKLETQVKALRELYHDLERRLLNVETYGNER